MAVTPLPCPWLPCGASAGAGPIRAPPSDARFLPVPGSVRLSQTWATGEGADGASWSPGSLGRRSEPCMPLAAETRSACAARNLQDKEGQFHHEMVQK